MKSASEINECKLDTRLSLLGRNPDEQWGFVNTPIYRGSTVIFNSCEDIRQVKARFAYGTFGTPTIESLEKAWSSLYGAAGTKYLGGHSDLLMG